jgi:hypothetical protein
MRLFLKGFGTYYVLRVSSIYGPSHRKVIFVHGVTTVFENRLYFYEYNVKFLVEKAMDRFDLFDFHV